jgi:hypothetical protein
MMLATRAFADPTSSPPRDALDEARALEGTLDYERALVIVDREIARGAATSRARLVELHLLAGKLAAGLDHPDVAQAHFARALALSPEVRLPDGTSPKITAPFEAALATTPRLAITLSPRTHGADSVMHADVGPDPAHVFSGLRLVGPSSQPVVAVGTEVAVPHGWAPSSVEAIDEYGNVLDRASVTAPEVPVVPVAPAPEPIYRRWSTWAIAAGGALAIGGIGAARFGAAQDQWTQLESVGGHEYSELATIEAHGRDWGLVADIGLGVASVTALTAIVMYALHDDRPRALAPTASAGALGLAIAF